MQDELREAVLVAERALLYALGFDLTVLHPFKIALDLAGQGIGFRLNMYTAQRNGIWDLYQVIFNLTNLRCGPAAPPATHTASERHGWHDCPPCVAQGTFYTRASMPPMGLLPLASHC